MRCNTVDNFLLLGPQQVEMLSPANLKSCTWNRCWQLKKSQVMENESAPTADCSFSAKQTVEKAKLGLVQEFIRWHQEQKQRRLMHHPGIFKSTDTGGYCDTVSNGEQEEFKPGK